MDWTEEMFATLEKMWLEGHTGTVIGNRLGMSASAVIGKAHRSGLPGRKPPVPNDPEIAERRRLTRAARRPSKAVWTAPEPPPAPPPPPVPATCSWPLGSLGKRGYRFCDEAPVRGKPYCAAHCQIAYLRPRREAA